MERTHRYGAAPARRQAPTRRKADRPDPPVTDRYYLVQLVDEVTERGLEHSVYERGPTGRVWIAGFSDLADAIRFRNRRARMPWRVLDQLASSSGS